MTIHKSKGLEFDTVILPGLASGSPAPDQPLLLWEEVTMQDTLAGSVTQMVAAPLIPKSKRINDLPTPYEYLRGLEKERAQNESLRVLYVAATRAERKLHLVGIVHLDEKQQLKEPSANSHLASLWPTIVAQCMQTAATFKAIDDSTKAEIDSATFIPKLIRLQQVGAPEILSQSVSSPSPVAQTENSSTQEDSKSLQLEKHIGILTHRYVELIADHLEAWSVQRLQNLQPAMLHWFRQQGYQIAEAEKGVTLVTDALMTTLNSEQGRWILQKHTQSAAEFALTTCVARDWRRRF